MNDEKKSSKSSRLRRWNFYIFTLCLHGNENYFGSDVQMLWEESVTDVYLEKMARIKNRDDNFLIFNPFHGDPNAWHLPQTDHFKLNKTFNNIYRKPKVLWTLH